MRLYYSGMGSFGDAAPEIALPSPCVMFSYKEEGKLEQTQRKRFRAIMKARRKVRKARKK